MIVGKDITGDRGELWLGTWQRVRDLLAQRTPDDMVRPVPAIPGHTVRGDAPQASSSLPGRPTASCSTG
jgi:hypothetical protein